MAGMAQYRKMVERLEREAETAPGRYRLKVALLALLGFAVLGGTVALSLGLSLGLILLLITKPILLLKLIKIIWIPIAFGWLVLKSLWIRFTPPEGYTLRKGEAPALEAEVEKLRVAAGAPKLDAIILDSDLNAAAASVPRVLGLFGYKQYLLLGLPLMHLLDVDEFRSVIAHEFGHFGGRHGRFGGWIYRVRAGWERVVANMLAQRSWASGLYRKFFEWYSPYFSAYSYVLARQNEYAADAMAAKLVGPEIAGQALVQVNLGSERLSRDFWPQLGRRVREVEAAPMALFTDMGTHMRLPHADEAQRLEACLQRRSDPDDTHPSLSRRLAALGVSARLRDTPPSPSAAEALLGDHLPAFEKYFSDAWHRNNAEAWAASNAQLKKDADRLDELEWQDTRTGEEEVERAELVQRLHPDMDALPLWRHALAAAPEDPLAHFRVGQLLLEQGDESGMPLLRRAAQLDVQAEEAVLVLIEQFHRQRGNDDDTDALDAERRRYYAQKQQAHDQRWEFTGKDVFLPSGLDAAALEKLREGLANAGNVKQAWIARKQLNDDGGTPHYVLLVTLRGFVSSHTTALEKVIEAVELPGSFHAITAENQRALARKIKKAAGAPCWKR